MPNDNRNAGSQGTAQTPTDTRGQGMPSQDSGQRGSMSSGNYQSNAARATTAKNQASQR